MTDPKPETSTLRRLSAQVSFTAASIEGLSDGHCQTCGALYGGVQWCPSCKKHVCASCCDHHGGEL